VSYALNTLNSPYKVPSVGTTLEIQVDMGTYKVLTSYTVVRKSATPQGRPNTGTP